MKSKLKHNFIEFLDQIPLWWLEILVTIVFFLPYFVLGDGCVFEINDQLDESIMNYMLPARHLWDGSTIYPEMLNGVNASGMQPSAVLFLPLYSLLSARVAFLTQYIACFLVAFLGMYLLVKEITDSSILAVIAGSCFCVLPLYPVWSVGVRYSTDPIRSPVPVETKKGDPGVTDHDRIRTDQSSGIYRICGAGLLGDRTCLCTYKKEKESVVSDGICGAFSHLCIGEPDFDL